ncbi:MAG: hypothetical protein AAF494_06865 [Pseudomonadota bacterium]
MGWTCFAKAILTGIAKHQRREQSRTGGKGQLSSVRDVLGELGIDNLAVIGIAKGPDHAGE